jgi:hypothetical protein
MKLREGQAMNQWEEVQRKKADMQRRAVAELGEQEQEILQKVLELEWDNRHLKTPDIRKTLRNFIQQVCK